MVLVPFHPEHEIVAFACYDPIISHHRQWSDGHTPGGDLIVSGAAINRVAATSSNRLCHCHQRR